MNQSPHDPAVATPPGRWPYLRDVLVFQFKLMLGNLLNVVLLPVSWVFAIWSLVAKHEGRLGAPFYRVLDLARDLEERINIYGAVGGYHAAGDRSPRPASEHIGELTVDDLIRRLEEAVIRETGKDGTAASLKTAAERLLDELRKRRR